MFNRIVQITAIVAVLGCGAANASPVFTVPPGLIGGNPGATVGWGFSILNDTPYWLLVDSSQFCQPGQDPQFTTCTTTLGSPTPDTGYTDLIANNTTVINPSSTLSEAYDPILQLGLGTYTISPTAPVAAIDSGNITITYVEFSGGNPLVPGSGATQVSADIELSGSASMQVAPEPGTLLTGVLSVLGLVWFGRLRARAATHSTGSSS